MTEKLFLNLEENYKIITEKIEKSAYKSGANPKDITFLAATKTVEPVFINHAISLGLNSIGENKVQELLSKYDSLNLENCDCQFIGKLQSNKIKFLTDKVSQIQSIDSMSQVKELSKQMSKTSKCMNVLIEVNIGNEKNKGGVSPENLWEFIDEASGYSGLKVNGLMTIPPICDENGSNCKYFLKMHQYFIDIRDKKKDNISMNILSMGMSDDFEEAIANGANMVRVGSALFGNRIYI
ncbi:MAG: YggS family pyridoxal phosphate-dependent enzyme [Clostridia bacterium]